MSPKTLLNLAKDLYTRGLRGGVLVESTMGVAMVSIGELPKKTDVPVIVEAQAVKTPFGGVLRVKLVICDIPNRPLAVTSILNPLNEKDQRIWLKLMEQEILPLLFYDGNTYTSMAVSLASKPFRNNKTYLEVALKWNEKGLDFNKAKAYVFENIPLVTAEDILKCTYATR